MIIQLSTKTKVEEWSCPASVDFPGKTLVFSDNVWWQSVGAHTVLTPQGDPVLAGTHSGTNRIVRVTGAGDGVYPQDVVVQEHEATWVLGAVTVPGTALAAGQVTVRGVLFWRYASPLPLELEEKRFAITGGTGPYAQARGTIVETGSHRTMDIVL
ncbi:hypothetical protein [Geodermatophilus sp. SYSU D00525]